MPNINDIERKNTSKLGSGHTTKFAAAVTLGEEVERKRRLSDEERKTCEHDAGAEEVGEDVSEAEEMQGVLNQVVAGLRRVA